MIVYHFDLLNLKKDVKILLLTIKIVTVKYNFAFSETVKTADEGSHLYMLFKIL